jgi:hypothetical protein
MTDQPDQPQWVDEVTHPGMRQGLRTLCEIARQVQAQTNHPAPNKPQTTPVTTSTTD